ncbi:Uncharacterized protein PBTT_09276 [Plasmodiophora brassicae]
MQAVCRLATKYTRKPGLHPPTRTEASFHSGLTAARPSPSGTLGESHEMMHTSRVQSSIQHRLLNSSSASV